MLQAAGGSLLTFASPPPLVPTQAGGKVAHGAAAVGKAAAAGGMVVGTAAAAGGKAAVGKAAAGGKAAVGKLGTSLHKSSGHHHSTHHHHRGHHGPSPPHPYVSPPPPPGFYPLAGFFSDGESRHPPPRNPRPQEVITQAAALALSTFDP